MMHAMYVMNNHHISYKFFFNITFHYALLQNAQNNTDRQNPLMGLYKYWLCKIWGIKQCFTCVKYHFILPDIIIICDLMRKSKY